MAGKLPGPDPDLDWEEVLKIIAAGATIDKRTKNRHPGLPREKTIYRHARLYPEWQKRLRAIFASRAANIYDWDEVARMIISGVSVCAKARRPAGMPSYSGIWFHARRHPEWAGFVAKGLRERKRTHNDLYGRAASAIPPGLPPDVRDDVIQDVVLAVLEGREGGDLKACAKAALTRHNAMSGRWKELSLDAPMPSFNDGRSFVDALDSECEHV